MITSERLTTTKNITGNAKDKFVPIRLEDSKDSDALKKNIARRAYEIFEHRGKVPGHDVDDWLEAESEVRWELH